MVFIAETAGFRDFIETQVTVDDQFPGFVDADAVQIRKDGDTHLFFEASVQIIKIHSHFPGDAVSGDFLRIGFGKKIDDFPGTLRAVDQSPAFPIMKRFCRKVDGKAGKDFEKFTGADELIMLLTGTSRHDGFLHLPFDLKEKGTVAYMHVLWNKELRFFIKLTVKGVAAVKKLLVFQDNLLNGTYLGTIEGLKGRRIQMDIIVIAGSCLVTLISAPGKNHQHIAGTKFRPAAVFLQIHMSLTDKKKDVFRADTGWEKPPLSGSISVHTGYFRQKFCLIAEIQ